jgi:hemoglobin
MSIYDDIGGETGVRSLVDRFYDRMDTLPEAQVIRAMHPASLDESRDRLFWFLSGWLGGPPLFVQKRGHPRLRARHLPFAVDAAARDAWMLCMRHALTEATLSSEIREKLDAALFQLADHMQNQSGNPRLPLVGGTGEPT